MSDYTDLSRVHLEIYIFLVKDTYSLQEQQCSVITKYRPEEIIPGVRTSVHRHLGIFGNNTRKLQAHA